MDKLMKILEVLSNLGLGLESMSPTKMCKIINDYEIVFQT
jgi:hypothetical protein